MRLRLAVFYAALIAAVLLLFATATYVTAMMIEAQESEPAEEKARELAQVRRLLFWSLAAGLPLSAGLSFIGSAWMTRRTLRSLADIVRVAGQIGPEHLQQRLVTHEDDDVEIRDLSQTLNQMLDRLDHAVAALRRFTSDAAHELRTPLATLISRLEIALGRPREPAQLRAVLEETHEGIGSLNRLIDMLLLLSRADAGELVGRQEPLQLHRLLAELISLYAGLASERELTLRCDCSQSIELLSDAVLLQRALANLLDNACKYALPGGSVVVAASQQAAAITIRVTDSGPGIPAEDRERVFERFYRRDEHRGSVDGFGLGLPLAREFVTALGGHIELHQAEGSGLEALIWLPSPRGVVGSPAVAA